MVACLCCLTAQIVHTSKHFKKNTKFYIIYFADAEIESMQFS